MDFEIRILKDIPIVKEQLRDIVDFYQEDFLLNDIVFVTIDDKSKLSSLLGHIQITDEQYANQF